MCEPAFIQNLPTYLAYIFNSLVQTYMLHTYIGLDFNLNLETID